MKDNIPPTAVEMPVEILEKAAEIISSQSDEAAKLDETTALLRENFPEKFDAIIHRPSLTLYHSYCSFHGIIGTDTSALKMMKRILDHKQSVGGPHSVKWWVEYP